ncbi:MAG: FKBP-type peptidyl-prolyl cis-trans isomerase [Bacteroidales bacterium]|nr:FKBP-type peptidyl-prolyl cis-trans isomerase [Bacteroidales bacterium]MDT8374165.1 FKBP-type peptidyl-prolyl cis-trans isomerase [Bacteroidales bacterium]
MKNVKILTVIVLCAVTTFTAAAQKSKFSTSEDSLSYALGVANYKYYVADSIDISTKLFYKGMKDAEKEKPVMNDTTASAFIVSYMQRREKARLTAEYSTQIQEAEAFFDENGKKEGVVVLPSGLQYKVLNRGTGATPGPDDVVRVHYTGTTVNGTKFDSSYDRGEPAQFRVSNVIKGWIEGLQLMQEGSKMMLYIPYDLAYGERGAGSIIKPFETLIFEVELLEVIKEDE